MQIGVLPAPASGPGGTATYADSLVSALLDVPGVEVDVLQPGVVAWLRSRRGTGSAGPVGSALTPARVPVSGRLYTSGPSRLRPSYDLVFGPHDVYHQLHLDVVPAVRRRRLVLTVHDLVAERWPDEGRLAPFAEPLLHRADAVVTVSAWTRDQLLQRFPSLDPAAVHVVHNGVDHGRFHPRDEGGDAELLAPLGLPPAPLLYVGGMTRRKNVAVLLAAHRDLLASRPGTPELVVLGPWEPEAFAARYAVHRGVRLVGAVRASVVPALVRHSRAIIVPSSEEGFGLPVLEAQACGVPVLCTDLPVFREVGGPAPCYAATGDAASLAAALSSLLDQGQEERERRLREGLQHAARFTWRACAERHAAVYRSVLQA